MVGARGLERIEENLHYPGNCAQDEDYDEDDEEDTPAGHGCGGGSSVVVKVLGLEHPDVM